MGRHFEAGLSHVQPIISHHPALGPKPKLPSNCRQCCSNPQLALVGLHAGAATCRICPESASTPSGGMPAWAQGVLHRGAVQVTALPTDRPLHPNSLISNRRSAAALHILNNYLYSNTSTI